MSELHINYSAVWQTTTTALNTPGRCVTTSRLHLECYGVDGMLEGTPPGQRTGPLVLSDNSDVKMAVTTQKWIEREVEPTNDLISLGRYCTIAKHLVSNNKNDQQRPAN